MGTVALTGGGGEALITWPNNHTQTLGNIETSSSSMRPDLVRRVLVAHHSDEGETPVYTETTK